MRKVLLAIVVFWTLSTITGVAAFYFDPELAPYRSDWDTVLLKRALTSIYWIGLSIAAVLWYRERIVDRTNWVPSLIVAALASIVLVVGFMAFKALVVAIVSLGERPFREVFVEDWRLELIYRYFNILQIAAAANIYHYYVRTLRREREQRELELRLLRAQLEPHFLFNTLNSIASLVRLKRSEEAVDAIHRLSTLLRHVLELGQNQVVPFSWEADFTRLYVALQELRFGDKLKVHLSVEEVPAAAMVPVMILQPLIENAILHGPLTEARPCEVDLSVRSAGPRIKVRVKNALGKISASGGSGVGLKNIASRLSRLYGADHRFTHTQEGAEFVVDIDFPAGAAT